MERHVGTRGLGAPGCTFLGSRLASSHPRSAPRTPLHSPVLAVSRHAVEPAVSVPAHQPQEAPLPLDTAVPIGAGLVVVAALALWRKLGKQAATQLGGRRGQSAYDAALEANPDGRDYRMALARTRQAVAVQRSIGFMNTGNTARTMVELRRALHENSVCRAPLINTLHDKAELQQLYRMHLLNSAVPADFATLLQLRTLLDLDFEEAENIEQEVMQQGSAYSI